MHTLHTYNVCMGNNEEDIICFFLQLLYVF